MGCDICESSIDSRYIGFIDEDDILASVSLRVFSLNNHMMINMIIFVNKKS